MDNLNPFREGNGRTHRVFIAQLAQDAGYRLDYSDLQQDQVYSAMEAAFHGKEKTLANLIRQQLSQL
jgi:cell filamentation protein